MSSYAYRKICAEIPRLVDELVSHYGICRTILETVYEVWPSGTHFVAGTYHVTEDDLEWHMARAEKMGLQIEVENDDEGFTEKVTITRPLKNGAKYIAVYTPLNESENKS